MAQTSNRFLDDLARLMTDAAGAAQGVRREVETVVKGQIERMLQDMNVATREEVDVLRDMVVAAREENERLAIRMKALEERLAGQEGHGAPAGEAATPSSPTAAQSEGAPGFIE
ncbi:MAG TPA: accessory factor UbiK family protein [Beijerinckiaceae bacterium]